MAMIINHNLSALNTYNQLNFNTNSMNKSLEKLSSGYRINSAADDAAGLAISEKMRGQIRGLDQANRNAQDGISMVQTAEGALKETESILQRMRELSVQAASDTNTDDDRASIQDEMNALVDEIDNISNTTQFNTKKLLDGSMDKAHNLQASVDNNSAIKAAGAGATIATNLSDMTDAAGNSLNIKDGDVITVSYMKNGQLVTGSYTVTNAANETLDDVIAGLTDSDGNSVAADFALSNNAAGGIDATANDGGYENAIYGLTLTVADSDGKVNTKATNALSSFTQTTAAQDDTLDGSSTVLIGANTGQSIKIQIGEMGATALGVAHIEVNSQEAANIAISVIDSATAKVSSARSKLGALQNRMESTINNLTTSSENLTSAESRIRDVDMASEMANYTKLSVITQAATAMLAQANQQPQQVLTLLK